MNYELLVAGQGFERQAVRVQSETADNAFAGASYHRYMTESLTSMHIRNMYLDNRRSH